jgi:hypothetical protein
MSIAARFEDGVFRPIGEAGGAEEGKLYRVFSDEEFRELTDQIAWLKAAETAFDFWDNEEDAVYDQL